MSETSQSQRPPNTVTKKWLLWTFLVMLLVAAIISTLGAIAAIKLQDKGLTDSKAEWGTPRACKVVERGPLIGWSNYDFRVQDITVSCAPTDTLTVKMSEQNGQRPSADVWQNKRTKEYFVAGDVVNTASVPYHPGYAAVIALGVTFLTMMVSNVSIFFVSPYLKKWLDKRRTRQSS